MPRARPYGGSRTWRIQRESDGTGPGLDLPLPPILLATPPGVPGRGGPQRLYVQVAEPRLAAG